MYPSVTSTIEAAPSSSCGRRALFGPALFVLFNVGDMLGRTWVCWLPRRLSSVLVLVMARLGFFPLLKALAGARPSWRPDGDAAAALAVLAFACTNGWLCTAIFVRAPQAVEAADRGTAGTLLVLFLNGGLILGSLLSFAVRG